MPIVSQFPLLPDLNPRDGAKPQPLDYSAPETPAYRPRWWEYLRDALLFLLVLAAVGGIFWLKARHPG